MDDTIYKILCIDNEHANICKLQVEALGGKCVQAGKAIITDYKFKEDGSVLSDVITQCIATTQEASEWDIDVFNREFGESCTVKN